jgi:short-subunit dehydrogenase
MDIFLQQSKDAFETNFLSAVRVTHAVVPFMVKRKSGIAINMGSLSGIV